jgi:hypothetical protein
VCHGARDNYRPPAGAPKIWVLTLATLRCPTPGLLDANVRIAGRPDARLQKPLRLFDPVRP